MNIQRSDASACTDGAKICEFSTYHRIVLKNYDDEIFHPSDITGGFNGHECLNTVEFYDPETEEWTLMTPMTTRRSGVNCVILNQVLYVIGGFNGTHRMNSGEKLELFGRNRQWTRIPSMFHPRSNFGLELIDDDSQLMAAGGYNGTVTIKVR